MVSTTSSILSPVPVLVDIGSMVTVQFQDGVIRDFKIVMEGQAVDPGKGIISNTSPLGQALLGKLVGQKIMYRTSVVEALVTVLSIGKP